MTRKLSILCALLTAALLGSLLTPRVVQAGAFVPVQWAALAAQVTGLTQLTGAGSATDDDLIVYDTSAGAIKRISRSELASVVTPTGYGCTAYRTTDVALNTTATALTLDSEVTDAGGFHDTGSNTERMTVPAGQGGLFAVSWAGGWVDTGAVIVTCQLYKNNSAITGAMSSQYNTADTVPPTGNFVLTLAAGDYIDLRPSLGSSTGTWYTSTGGNKGQYVHLTIMRLGN